MCSHWYTFSWFSTIICALRIVCYWYFSFTKSACANLLILPLLGFTYNSRSHPVKLKVSIVMVVLLVAWGEWTVKRITLVIKLDVLKNQLRKKNLSSPQHKRLEHLHQKQKLTLQKNIKSSLEDVIPLTAWALHFS